MRDLLYSSPFLLWQIESLGILVPDQASSWVVDLDVPLADAAPLHVYSPPRRLAVRNQDCWRGLGLFSCHTDYISFLYVLSSR